MIVRRASDDEREICYDIRRVVFIDGQNVPPDRERDADDNSVIHFLAFHDEKPVATARVLLRDGGSLGKIQRVGVLDEARGSGIGKKLMSAIEADLALEGVRFFELDSQTHAVPFYEKIGYKRLGEEFIDAGIMHFHMKKICPGDKPS